MGSCYSVSGYAAPVAQREQQKDFDKQQKKAKEIIDEILIPNFRDESFYSGLDKGIDSIIEIFNKKRTDLSIQDFLLFLLVIVVSLILLLISYLAFLKNRKIRIIKNIESIQIETYESELVQVLMSILNNSRDAFSNVENQEKLIFIDISIDDKDIVIKLKDNAGGVKNDILNKIYEPYFTTKHKAQGTGIGLYMCEEMITKHMNGKIESTNKKYIYDDIEYKGLETIITLYS